MKLVPKPEGFDLRDKRSTRSGKANDWTPADALYDASKRTAEAEVTQLVVVWWEKQDGKEVLRYAQSTESRAEHAYLLHKALNHVMGP